MGNIREILESAKTVAVVGISRDPSKAAGHVPADLQKRGFTIIPVNPKGEEILGEKAYGSLRDIPQSVDVVEVFRPAPETPGIAKQAVEIGAKTLWLQSGIRSEEARRIAQAGGLEYVEDRCMATEAHLLDVDK